MAADPHGESAAGTSGASNHEGYPSRRAGPQDEAAAAIGFITA